jgi:hypothetical protein
MQISFLNDIGLPAGANRPSMKNSSTLLTALDAQAHAVTYLAPLDAAGIQFVPDPPQLNSLSFSGTYSTSRFSAQIRRFSGAEFFL